MSKPHIKRVFYKPCYGKQSWGWALWHTKDSYKSGDAYPVWSEDLDRLKEFYFIYRGLV